MRFRSSFLFTVFISLSLCSCATIMGKDSYTVSIQSVPSNAQYEIINRKGTMIRNGTTPDSVSLKSSAGFFKGEHYKITFKKDGYETKTYDLKSGISGWYMGNVLFGGPLGILIIDPATGKMFTLPEKVHVQLSKNAHPTTQKEHKLLIKDVNELSNDEIFELKPINVQ